MCVTLSTAFARAVAICSFGLSFSNAQAVAQVFSTCGIGGSGNFGGSGSFGG